MLHLYTVDVQGTRLYRLKYPAVQRLSELPPHDNDRHVIVRWGNSRLAADPQGAPIEFRHVLNPSTAIQLNCKKPVALAALSEVVRTPRIYHKRVPKRNLVVVRPLTHEAGAGFRVQRGPFRIPAGHYATEFIHTDIEYRVWFCGDKTLCARRVPHRAVDNDANQRYKCRSEWGYRFRKTPKVLHQATLKAAKRIGLDVGAADILYKAKGAARMYTFLELNSSPSVDHRKIRVLYQRHLPKLAKKRFPDCHIQPLQAD